jgi:hypothetical protein
VGEVGIGITFSPYIIAAVCLIHVLLFEKKEGIENIFEKPVESKRQFFKCIP